MTMGGTRRRLIPVLRATKDNPAALFNLPPPAPSGIPCLAPRFASTLQKLPSTRCEDEERIAKNRSRRITVQRGCLIKRRGNRAQSLKTDCQRLIPRPHDAAEPRRTITEITSRSRLIASCCRIPCDMRVYAGAVCSICEPQSNWLPTG